MVNKDKLLDTLARLEININENEQDAKRDIDKCSSPKLFNFIATASSYRILSGYAEEEYPDDSEIKEHVKSSTKFLVEKATVLTSKFEKDCLCLPRDRIGTELKKVLTKYKYPI